MRKLVRIVWHDAADEAETWMKDAEIDEEAHEVVSVGYVVRATPKYWTLAGDIIEGEDPTDPTWGRVTRIPCGMVQRVDVLEGGDDVG